MARNDLSDERLFNRLTQGDKESLRPLMERHGDALTLYINGYLHDLDMAEDIMLEAFSRMLVKAPHLREGGFKPYLYKTARNLAFRHLKERSRFLSLEDMAQEPADVRLVEEGLLADERRRSLYRHLGKIPADYREALYLVYIEEMSYDEAGAVMRKSRKQVDNLVQRGKRAMKALMEGGREESTPDAACAVRRSGNRAAEENAVSPSPLPQWRRA
ncbi:MAG: sigma-70 family RNA polymerase sigma factor [Coriobacteriia bacterium]|nr:sigma-70 family RNA polymerase sigma factor [Coriobacteriia bacterium]